MVKIKVTAHQSIVYCKQVLPSGTPVPSDLMLVGKHLELRGSSIWKTCSEDLQVVTEPVFTMHEIAKCSIQAGGTQH